MAGFQPAMFKVVPINSVTHLPCHFTSRQMLNSCAFSSHRQHNLTLCYSIETCSKWLSCFAKNIYFIFRSKAATITYPMLLYDWWRKQSDCLIDELLGIIMHKKMMFRFCRCLGVSYWKLHQPQWSFILSTTFLARFHEILKLHPFSHQSYLSCFNEASSRRMSDSLTLDCSSFPHIYQTNLWQLLTSFYFSVQPKNSSDPRGFLPVHIWMSVEHWISTMLDSLV